MDNNNFDFDKLGSCISLYTLNATGLSDSEEDAACRTTMIMEHLAALYGETWHDKFIIAICQQGRRDTLIVKPPAGVKPNYNPRVQLWLNGLKFGYGCSSLENPYNRTVHKVYTTETMNELCMLYGWCEPKEVPVQVAQAIFSLGGTKQPLDFVPNMKLSALVALRLHPERVAS